MTTNLIPCRFCHSPEARITAAVYTTAGHVLAFGFVRCLLCGAQGPDGKEGDPDGIAGWNGRAKTATIAELRAQIVFLEKTRDELQAANTREVERRRRAEVELDAAIRHGRVYKAWASSQRLTEPAPKNEIARCECGTVLLEGDESFSVVDAKGEHWTLCRECFDAAGRLPAPVDVIGQLKVQP